MSRRALIGLSAVAGLCLTLAGCGTDPRLGAGLSLSGDGVKIRPSAAADLGPATLVIRP